MKIDIFQIKIFHILKYFIFGLIIIFLIYPSESCKKGDTNPDTSDDVIGFIKLKKYFRAAFAVTTYFPDDKSKVTIGDIWGSNDDGYVPIEWDGNSFSITDHYMYPSTYCYDYEFSGTMLDDGTITDLTYHYKMGNNCEYNTEHYFKLENVKVTKISRELLNSDTGWIKWEMSEELTPLNGEVYDLWVNEPYWETAISFEEDFEVIIWFADNYNQYENE